MELEKKKQSLLEYYRRTGTAKVKEVIEAFNRVPRENFVHEHQRSQVYDDHPLPIGSGQTISAPHMAFIMCEMLELKEGDQVLEIGAGSGYHAAICAALVAPIGTLKPGHVYTVERIPELVEFARENLKRAGFADLVTVVQGDGTIGYPEKAPYDAIQVTAAGPKVPKPLTDQLKVGGRLVIPVGGRHMYQELILVTRVKSDKLVEKKCGGVAFVPLIGEHGF